MIKEKIFFPIIFLFIPLAGICKDSKEHILSILNERYAKSSEKVSNLVITERIEYPGNKLIPYSDLTIYKKKQKIRLEIETNSQEKSKNIFIFDGNEYYQIYAGFTKKVSLENLEKVESKHVDFENSWIKEIISEGTNFSQVKEGNVSYYLFSGKKNNRFYELWMDKKFYIPYKIICYDTEHASDKLKIIITRHTNLMDCLYIPLEILIHTNNILAAKTKVIKINTDFEIPESYFKVDNNQKVEIKTILKNLFE